MGLTIIVKNSSRRFRGPRRPWPMVSTSMAVSPRQVQELRAELKKHNCGAEVRPDGKVVIHSPKQQKEFCKIRGVCNLDSYD